MPTTEIAQVRRLMADDERVGMGFNSDSGLAVGTPFELTDLVVEEDPSAPGQKVFSTITIVNSHEELMESMSLAVEAEGRYGFFSADLKPKFANSTNYNSTSTFLIAKVIVENPFKRGRNFQLTGNAKSLVKTQQDAFKTAFGDSFVRGIQTGGEFYSVIRLTSVSTSTQNDLAAELQAEYNGLAAAGSFETKFQKANSTSSTRSEFSAMMFQKAGTGREISPTLDIAEVLARVKQFPLIVEQKPVAYEIEVATYNTLPLPLPTPEEEAIFQLALQDASGKRLHYIQMRNDLEFARQHPEFFEDLPEDQVLVNAIRDYTRLLNEVMRHGVDLSTGRMQPPQIFDPNALNPPLVEPAPIPLKRVAASAFTVHLPNLVGVDWANFVGLLSCLEHQGSLNSCLDGTAFPGPDGEVSPITIDREIAEFPEHGRQRRPEGHLDPERPRALGDGSPRSDDLRRSVTVPGGWDHRSQWLRGHRPDLGDTGIASGGSNGP